MKSGAPGLVETGVRRSCACTHRRDYPTGVVEDPEGDTGIDHVSRRVENFELRVDDMFDCTTLEESDGPADEAGSSSTPHPSEV